ncbi:MAG TPA: hypothetical protein VGE43_02015, partial [Acidimicrobiales bacterium]
MDPDDLPPSPPPPPPPPQGHAEEAAERLRERALLHRTEQTRTYPCLQCGGELEWDITRQLLTCPFCGNEQEVGVVDGGEIVEQDLDEAMAALDAGALTKTGLQVSDEKEVVCQNCGGHTT